MDGKESDGNEHNAKKPQNDVEINVKHEEEMV